MAETLDDTRLRLETIIKENYPDADIAPGTVLSELLIKLNATLQNPITNAIADIDQASAVSKVLTSDVDTYDAIIDAVGSNYNVVRNQGKKSIGKIKVIVSTSKTYSLRAGFTFNQPVLDLSYVTIADVRALPTPTDAGDVPLMSSNGVYYFVIPVVATDVGPQYQVSDQSQFDIGDNFSIPNFVSAAAYGNFTSGQAMETDQELVARFQTGISNKSLLTPKSILFRLQSSYPNVTNVSVIGANDAEMVRSKENIFGISTLGMADVYVRSSIGPETATVIKTATKTGSTVDTSGVTQGVWMTTLDVADAPGFYRIVSIIPTQQNVVGTLLNNVEFAYNNTSNTGANCINNVTEARFTAYQTATVTFYYQSEDTIGTAADFELLCTYQPNILDIQTLFLSSDERIACADYLVRGVIPCYVTVSLVIHRKDPNVDLPLDSIKQDIFNYINQIPFGDALYVSRIIDICHNYNVKYVEMPVTLTGSIYTPSSAVLSISGSNVLTIPTNLALGVSPKTVLFFVDYFNSSNSTTYNMSDSISIKVV